MSKVTALYHIVFCTKYRKMTITNDHREDLYRYIWRLMQNKDCFLKRISGIPNHLHLLIDLNPSIALADLMRDLKTSTSHWLKKDPRFPMFEGWGKEYFATSISVGDQDGVIEYIKSQQSHHAVKSFDDEIAMMCEYGGFALYEDDFR